MAIYHLSIKIISRGKGKSAVAAAAYRAGEKITNEYDDTLHDFTKKGGIAHTEILLPDHAPREYFDRSVLWNAVERIEKNCNAQLAREIELALPVELSQEENINLIREYVNRHFVAAGMCADICIHDKNDGNPHAHVMLTMRPIELDGSWSAKSKKEYVLAENGERIRLSSGAFKTRKTDMVDWNDHSKAEVWRQGWADMVNATLERRGVAERIDHRSYERQGIDQIPTVHLGVAAFQMERRGIKTERGDQNRQIQPDNNMIRQLRARINKLEGWLSEQKQAAAPSLADELLGILKNPEEKSRRQKITDLQTFAKVVAFVQQHSIADVSNLRDKVRDMYAQLADISNSLKKVERRMKTLDEHIRHSGDYFKYRALYKDYEQQKPNKQEAFYERHRAELALYEAAEKYLRQVMNGRTGIPTKAWNAEAGRLAAEKDRLYAEYAKLKEGVRNAEVIRRYVENATRGERGIVKEKGAEL